jgi:hypothetical protein
VLFAAILYLFVYLLCKCKFCCCAGVQVTYGAASNYLITLIPD